MSTKVHSEAKKVSLDTPQVLLFATRETLARTLVESGVSALLMRLLTEDSTFPGLRRAAVACLVRPNPHAHIQYV